jgi:hypothetical protein
MSSVAWACSILTVAGLVLTGWGAYVAAQAVILKPADAMDIGVGHRRRAKSK